jgi:hypothetical protein
MKYCIHRSVLGTDAHLVIDDGYTWVSKAPEECWTLGDKSGIMSLDKIAELFRMEIPAFVSLPQAKFFLSLGIKPHNVSWQKALNAQTYKETIKGLIDGCGDVVDAFEESGYENTYLNNQRFLRGLGEAHINGLALAAALRAETDPGQITNLNSFKGEGGVAKCVIYDTCGTSTGRMTVSSGPKILTLKREHRSIVESRFAGGEIVSIDYSSLEPRIALALQGHSPRGDIYAWVDDYVFKGSLGRSTAKILTLSIIYGMSIHNAGRRYGKITPKQKKQLREIFGIDEIEDQDLENNAYGRPIYPDSDRKRFNAYIQSTAVDAAVSGFSKICSLFPEAIPLFLIHDELVCDVPPGTMSKMSEILKDGIEIDLLGKPVNLEVKVEKFSERD